MYSIGYDIGSSSIKAALIEIESGRLISSKFYPENEMAINSPQPGWAEQNPETWWEYAKIVTGQILKESSVSPSEIKSIGISYQMHGLVAVDKNLKVIRPSIIWCDSRAVETGNNAAKKIGTEKCLKHLLNSPGNFTASKLRWVKENEPENFSSIYKIMLPGDFIALRMSGKPVTTISGLSEGIFWDFVNNSVSKDVMNTYELDESLLSDIKPTFGQQGELTKSAAAELGLKEGTVISYRAGDQPNNAFSLNVLRPGEIAATAGTSGVVYGVIDQINYDPLSRVNQFAHVNHTADSIRLGVLLCINGTGILNSWLRKNVGGGKLSYSQMNDEAAKVSIGSEGLVILPFGNGAERVLENKNIGSMFSGIDFNRHTSAHVFRAAQEGIVFSFKYGIDIMKEMGLDIKVIRAGKANMFLSSIFSEALANTANAAIELYDTDGAQGAARGAAYGAGYYKSVDEAFRSLTKIQEIQPDKNKTGDYKAAYEKWLSKLKTAL